jgi:proteasome lid subunit RPN8/RPN11
MENFCKVRLRASDYEAMAAHARSGLPNEVCGLLAGHSEGSTEKIVKVVEKVYCLPNADASREHFSIDPREQLTAVKDLRTKGLRLLGNFHSHPETPARPSAEDIRLAYDPSLSYLILSLAGAGKTPEIKSFRIEKGAVSPEEIELV